MLILRRSVGAPFRPKAALALALALFAATPSAEAGLVYQISQPSGPVFGPFSVTLSVAYDGTGANPLSAPGLGAVSLGLRLDNTSTASASVSLLTSQPGFDPPAQFAPGGFPSIVGFTNLEGLGLSTLGTAVTTPGGAPLFLASYDITPTASGNLILVVGLLDPAGGFANIADDLGAVYNPGSNPVTDTAAFTVTLAGVPEPNSLTLCCLGMVLCGWFARRVRHARYPRNSINFVE